MSVNIFLLRIETPSGQRFIDDSFGRTQHPSTARRFDLNEFLPAHLARIIDEYVNTQFVPAAEARCLDSMCTCIWSDTPEQARAKRLKKAAK
jgi:hypothetical protein